MSNCFHHSRKVSPPWGRCCFARPRFVKGIALLLCAQLLAGCGHLASSEIQPAVTVPAAFSRARQNTAPERDWWQSFQDPALNGLLERAFGSSFTLKQGYARIRQAKISSGQAGSELYPALASDISLGSSWLKDGVQEKRYRADVNFSWELDLWQRLSAAEKALSYETDSATADLQAAAFLLSARIAENYLHLIEQNLQLDLLQQQQAASSIFLELIELRFANGEASVVDIYQQRQHLASLRTQVPIVKNQALLLKNRLAVLIGAVPGTGGLPVADRLPELPPGPDIGIPGDLLLNRPDLRSIHAQLLAADQKIGEAIADRLPRLNLTGSTGYSGASFSADNFFMSIMGDIFMPLIDWGKRKSEVAKRKYFLEELLATYTQTFLTAIEETENGIWQEKYQTELLDSLTDHLQIAKANLTETRNRYMQGLTDYLPVLTALQSLQQLEREVLTQNRQLLLTRVHLYRALGGAHFLAMPGKEPGKEL